MCKYLLCIHIFTSAALNIHCIIHHLSVTYKITLECLFFFCDRLFFVILAPIYMSFIRFFVHFCAFQLISIAKNQYICYYLCNTLERRYKMNKKLRITFMCIAIVIGILLSAFGTVIFDPVDISFDTEQSFNWNEGWVHVKDGVETPILLPTSVEADRDEPVVIENTVPDFFIPNRSIMLRLTMQELKVEVGDEVIFEYVHSDKFLAETVGSSWQIVRLPQGCEGETIRITVTSPYKMSSGTINNILLGSKSAVTFAIFKQHFPRMFISILIMLFGILFIILGFVFRSLGSDVARITYLGWFTMLVSIWLLCESRMLQFFTGNHFLITNLVFIAIMLVPLPLLMYVESSYTMHMKSYYPHLIWAGIINFFVCVFLQLTGIADFFQTVFITHFLIVICMVYFISTTIYEAVKYKNSDAVSNLISISVLCFFCMLELFNFYAGSFAYVTDFFAAGIMVYVIMLCYDTYKYVIYLFEKSAEARHFERLANFDALTHGRNRLSFTNDLSNLWCDNDRGEMWLCFFDLNDLKLINDTFGHHIGDMALKQTYECISRAFDTSENCYRVGGDEFACIFKGSFQDFSSRLSYFNDCIISEAKKVAFPFNIATGYVAVDSNKYASVDEMLIDVDKKMYADKLSKKN